MDSESPLVQEAYALARQIYEATAKFPEKERGSLGQQLRDTTLDLATQTIDAVTTDDPAERQEALRQAMVACVRVNLLLRLAGDMGHFTLAEIKAMSGQVETLNDGVARERRVFRY